MHATTKLTSQAIIAKFSWTESNSSVAKHSKPITCAYEAQKIPPSWTETVVKNYSRAKHELCLSISSIEF